MLVRGWKAWEELGAWLAWLLGAVAWWLRNEPTAGGETPEVLQADCSYLAELAHDLGRVSLKSWSLPPAASLFPDVPIFLGAEAVTGDWRSALVLSGLVGWLAATLAVRLVSSPSSRAPAVAVMAVALVLASRIEVLMPLSFLMVAHHGWAALTAFVVLALRIEQPFSAWAKALLSLWVALVTLSDPWVHFFLSVPVIGCFVWSRRAAKPSPRQLWLVFAATLGTLVGFMVLPRGVLHSYFDVPPAKMLNSFKAIAGYAWQQGFAAVAFIAGVVMAVRQRKPLALAVASSVLVTIAFGLFIDDRSVRYWGVVFLASMTGLVSFVEFTRPWVRTLVTVAALAFGGITVGEVDRTTRIPYASWEPAFVTCVKARGLHQGVGDYWSARLGRLWGLSMPAASFSGAPDGWISPHHARLERFEFVVLTGLAQSTWVDARARGTIEQCGPSLVLFPSNEDQRWLAQQFFQVPTQGCFVPPLPALRGHIFSRPNKVTTLPTGLEPAPRH